MPRADASREGTDALAATGGKHDRIAIVDFGSQYTQLIARRVRELGLFSSIHPCHAPLDAVLGDRETLRGLVLSGGPRSVYDADAPALEGGLLDAGVPVLGICYGLQATVRLLGGEVERGEAGGEYGRTTMTADGLPGAPASSAVWMSHGDRVVALPDGFVSLAASEGCPHAAVEGLEGRFLGLQFHPEVTHTEHGTDVLRAFLLERCAARPTWRMAAFLEEAIAAVATRVGGGRVLCALSGGVDSSSLALLLHRALGTRLTCVFVDNGLLRQGEAESVVATFGGRFGIDLVHVDARERFLASLAGVTDPEEKRRRVGRLFIETFAEVARDHGEASFLAQGTLYPDVIESVAAHGGPTATIKTHHNVGGLPDDLAFELVEPFRTLFKDEVRELGRQLGLPPEVLERHPFPGPGLAVRCLGEVTPERLTVLRAADAIVREELSRSGWMARTSQAFCVLLPVRSVGVMGDGRTYESVLAVRSVDTSDFMTADWSRLPPELLDRVAHRVINEVDGINRVVYDVSSKPPATIEWE